MVPSFILPFRDMLHAVVLHLRSFATMCDCYWEFPARGTNKAALFVDENAAVELPERASVGAAPAVDSGLVSGSFLVKKSAFPVAECCTDCVTAGSTGLGKGAASERVEKPISAPGTMLPT